MSIVPEDLRYTETHEWIRVDGEMVKIGITDHAQEELTDIVYIELPEVGKKVKMGEEIATVESVKAASDIYSPVSGEIVEVNEKLRDSPELLNTSPYEEGWIVIIKIENMDDVEKLMTAEQYKEKIEKQ